MLDQNNTILQVRNLSVDFKSKKEIFRAVKSISFSIDKGKTHALVGESGSGKSVTALSILQLLPYHFYRILIGFILLLLQAFSEIIKRAAALSGHLKEDEEANTLAY